MSVWVCATSSRLWILHFLFRKLFFYLFIYMFDVRSRKIEMKKVLVACGCITINDKTIGSI